MKKLLSFFMMCCLAIGGTFAEEPVLRFHKNGEFKIVQFTDIHYKYEDHASDVAIRRMNEIIEIEKPDLVMFTGDLVYKVPGDRCIREVLACTANHKVPFAVVFGNHDFQQGKTNAELYDVIRTIPYNVQPDRGNVESPDYTLSIKSSKDASKDACNLYCLDSHSGSLMKDVEGYDWFKFSQVQWFREKSQEFKDKNAGDTIPALAFFHIPLQEFNQAAESERTILIGTRMEPACSGALNTGMFAAMKEAGDVMGIFVGHDHDNDYAVMWHNILLAYGRYTGGNTEYNHLPNGARVIVLKEGERNFKTWITLKKGKRINETVYPDSYVKDNWEKRPLEMD